MPGLDDLSGTEIDRVSSLTFIHCLWDSQSHARSIILADESAHDTGLDPFSVRTESLYRLCHTFNAVGEARHNGLGR